MRMLGRGWVSAEVVFLLLLVLAFCKRVRRREASSSRVVAQLSPARF